MKKLIIFLFFSIGLVLNIQAAESLVIKIGKQITVYTIDLEGSNYWGEKVSIKKHESLLPDDNYLRNSGEPEKEWDFLTENKNGIYYSLLEKYQEDYFVLENKYQKLLKEKPNSINANKYLEQENIRLKTEKDTIKNILNKKVASITGEKNKLIKEYNSLFAQNTRQQNFITILKISLIIMLSIIIFLIIKLFLKNKKIKKIMA